MNTDERMAWFTEKVEDILGFKHNLENLAGTDYFTAPASTTKHHAYEGGLFDHSKEMFEELLSINAHKHDRFLEKYDKIGVFPFTYRECFVIGMFHDLCKVNLYVDNYVYNKKFKRSQPISEENPKYVISEAKPTERDEKQLTLPHGERSARYAAKLLPDLTEREYHYIRWHMEHNEPGWLGHDNVQHKMEKFYPEWRLLPCR